MPSYTRCFIKFINLLYAIAMWLLWRAGGGPAEMGPARVHVSRLSLRQGALGQRERTHPSRHLC